MSSPQHRRVLARTLLTSALLAAAMLFFFPPTQYGFYPPCPIHLLFGIDCPGCGTTRAIAALLHGHVAQALRLNAFATLLSPIAALYAAINYRRTMQSKRLS